MPFAHAPVTTMAAEAPPSAVDRVAGRCVCYEPLLAGEGRRSVRVSQQEQLGHLKGACVAYARELLPLWSTYALVPQH